MCFYRFQTVFLVRNLIFLFTAVRDALGEIHVRERLEVFIFQWYERLPTSGEVDRVALNVVMNLAVLVHQALRLDKERYIVARVFHL